VTRCIKIAGERTYWQIDIEYGELGGQQNAITNWKRLVNDEFGGLRAGGVTVVGGLELNVALDDKAFAYEFPVDTLVTDRTGEGIKVYMVREGGRQREVLRSERLHRLKYDLYRTTETGEAID
jgi:hypothetical protein